NHHIPSLQIGDPDVIVNHRHEGFVVALRKSTTTTRTSLDLNELAELADQLAEVCERSPEVCQVARASSDTVTFATMQKQIEELTRTVAALSASDFRGRSRCSCDRDYGTSHHRSQSRRRSRSRPRNRELCWYHDRFGAKAKKCEPDCKWSVIEKDRLN
ncbi:hypothetical protein ACJJTC_010820, partial [Scirpophaga incertulas]